MQRNKQKISLTLVIFKRPDGCVDYVREVVYDNDVPCFRHGYRGLTPISEADLQRSAYYRDDDGYLQWTGCAIEVLSGLFEVGNE